jgi:ABC-2 type transport system ATP-binding protein
MSEYVYSMYRADKFYGAERQVLANISLSFLHGAKIGVLGPNGAGKSTLLGLAASVLSLDKGRVSIGGLVPDGARRRASYRRRVAWMPQTVQPVSGLTAREQIALHGWLAGMARTDAWDRAAGALDRVGLTEQSGTRASQLSGGQRARVGLAQALVKDAGVMLLDEPTASLDPDQKEAFATLLHELTGQRTVVVSTHDVSDLEESYEHVIVFVRGRVRYQGGVSAFLALGGDDRSAVTAYRAAMGDR